MNEAIEMFIRKTDNTEEWPDGERPITFTDKGDPTIWWYLFSLPMIGILLCFHHFMCFLAIVMFRTEKRRKQFYEYYPMRVSDEQEDKVQAMQACKDRKG